MDKLNLKILTISKDANLAMDEQKLGDVQQRNVEYGKFVKAIYSVTYSAKKQNLPNKTLGDNVFIFPTNSMNRMFFYGTVGKWLVKFVSNTRLIWF